MSHFKGLHNLFSSNFYIEEQYAVSFVPTLLHYINSGTKIELTPSEKLIKNSQSEELLGDSETIISIISIKQPILKYSDYWMGWLGSKSFISILKNLENRSDVLGVVLDIDSGGGQSYGTPEFYDVIRNFSKPIVAYTDGYMCSAAYYIGNACSYIVANQRADAIGSIGAYTHFVDFSGLLEKYGAKAHTIYATKSTEKNLEVREALDNNYKPYIQNILDPMVETFHADMKSARPGLDANVFKGGVWGAEKAKTLGLIDEIGTIETAIMKVAELSKSNNNFKNSDMSKENSFPKLATVLGIVEVEAKKAHIFATTETVSLNAEQLSLIEAALTDPSGDSQKLAELQTQLDIVNANKKTAEDRITVIETAVNTAMETANLSTEKKPTLVENINLLAAKVVEYGSGDGSVPTSVTSKGDPTGDRSVESTAIYDSLVK